MAAFLTGWVSYAKLVFPIEEQPVNVACGLERNIDPQFLRQLRGEIHGGAFIPKAGSCAQAAPDIFRRPPLVQGVQTGEVLVLWQAYLPMFAREIGEIALAPEILLHHLYRPAPVDSLPHICPVDVVSGGLAALLVQPDGTAGGLAPMLNDGQAIFQAEPV